MFFTSQNFWGEAIAICTDNKTKLIAPKLEVDRAQQVSKDCEIISTERGSDMISTFISEINGKVTCTDCSDYYTIEAIQNKIGKKSFVINNEPFLQSEELKMKKKSKRFRKAAGILDNLYQLCTEEIKSRIVRTRFASKTNF